MALAWLEIRNLRARENWSGLWVARTGRACVCEPDESLAVTCRDGARRCSTLRGSVEWARKKTAGKLLSMSTEHKCGNWATSKSPHHYEFAISCRWTLRPRLVLIWQRMLGLGRSIVACIGIWIEVGQPWEVVCCARSETLSRQKRLRASGHHSGLYGSFLFERRFDRQPQRESIGIEHSESGFLW